MLIQPTQKAARLIRGLDYWHMRKGGNIMEKVIKTSIEQLINAISDNEDFEAIQHDNESLVKPYLEVIKTELRHVHELVNLEGMSAEQGKSNFYNILVHLHNAQSSASLFESSLIAAQTTRIGSKIKGALQNAANWVKNHLIPWLQNLWSSVWGLIQKLITPTGWKLSGELGTGVLGFAKATIEISFG